MKDFKYLKDTFSKLNLRANVKHSNDFNFFSPYVDKKKETKNKYIYSIATLVILLSLFTGNFLWNFIRIDNNEKAIDKLKKTIDSPESKTKLSEADKVKKKYDVLNKYYGQVYSITSAVNNKEIISSKLMERICSNIPEKVSFKSFSITVGEKGNGGNIQIQGAAETRANVAELEHNLKGLNEIKEVQVSNITDLNSNLEENLNYNENNDLSSAYSFTIKCVLKDVDKYEAE